MQEELIDLLPCPFCAAGENRIDENGRIVENKAYEYFATTPEGKRFGSMSWEVCLGSFKAGWDARGFPTDKLLDEKDKLLRMALEQLMQPSTMSNNFYIHDMIIVDKVFDDILDNIPFDHIKHISDYVCRSLLSRNKEAIQAIENHFKELTCKKN